MSTMILRVFDVEHGACTMLAGPSDAVAMIDCGHNGSSGWRPSGYLSNTMRREYLDYLLITNADQDHLSDLSTLRQSGISIRHLISNSRVSPEALRLIKLRSGPVTPDAEAFLQMRTGFGAFGTGIPFGQGMGGVSVSSFGLSFPAFTNTNDLSCVFFISFGPFKIMFPGDIEKAGWRAHLQDPTFRAHLCETTILVASHHGRESGFCEEAFEYLKPQAVVMSDKSVIHGTQEMVPAYRSIVHGDGIIVTNEQARRHVLTTRCDGDIVFRVEDNGNYKVTVRA